MYNNSTNILRLVRAIFEEDMWKKLINKQYKSIHGTRNDTPPPSLHHQHLATKSAYNEI